MNRVRVLRQLVAEGMYVVDAQRVADAILARAAARMTMPDLPIRNDRYVRVRSFRLEHEVRSFRLTARPRARRLPH
jgi:hypothetical protein